MNNSITDISNSLLSIVPKACHFETTLDDWIRLLRSEGRSERTISDYVDKTSKFTWWVKSLGISHPNHVTVNVARDYVTYLRTKNLERWGMASRVALMSPSSISAYGRSVSAYFNFLVRDGVIEKNPFKGVSFSTRQTGKTKPKTLTIAQIREIMMFLNKDATDYEGKRNHAIIALLADTGLRRGELINLRVGDFDFNRNIIDFSEGKTGGGRVSYTDTAHRALVRYIHGGRDKQPGKAEDYFWLNRDGTIFSLSAFDSMVQRLSAQVGFHFSPHMFRHTFATLLVENEVHIADVQRLLRHKNISTTMIYVNQSSTHLAEVQRTKSPLELIKGSSGRGGAGRPKKGFF